MDCVQATELFGAGTQGRVSKAQLSRVSRETTAASEQAVNYIVPPAVKERLSNECSLVALKPKEPLEFWFRSGFFFSVRNQEL